MPIYYIINLTITIVSVEQEGLEPLILPCKRSMLANYITCPIVGNKRFELLTSASQMPRPNLTGPIPYYSIFLLLLHNLPCELYYDSLYII